MARHAVAGEAEFGTGDAVGACNALGLFAARRLVLVKASMPGEPTTSPTTSVLAAARHLTPCWRWSSTAGCARTAGCASSCRRRVSSSTTRRRSASSCTTSRGCTASAWSPMRRGGSSTSSASGRSSWTRSCTSWRRRRRGGGRRAGGGRARLDFDARDRPPWTLLDHFSRRDRRATFDELERLYGIGRAPASLVPLIAGRLAYLRRLNQAHERREPAATVAADTGRRPFFVQKELSEWGPLWPERDTSPRRRCWPRPTTTARRHAAQPPSTCSSARSPRSSDGGPSAAAAQLLQGLAHVRAHEPFHVLRLADVRVPRRPSSSRAAERYAWEAVDPGAETTTGTPARAAESKRAERDRRLEHQVREAVPQQRPRPARRTAPVGERRQDGEGHVGAAARLLDARTASSVPRSASARGVGGNGRARRRRPAAPRRSPPERRRHVDDRDAPVVAQAVERPPQPRAAAVSASRSASSSPSAWSAGTTPSGTARAGSGTADTARLGGGTPRSAGRPVGIQAQRPAGGALRIEVDRQRPLTR